MRVVVLCGFCASFRRTYPIRLVGSVREENIISLKIALDISARFQREREKYIREISYRIKSGLRTLSFVPSYNSMLSLANRRANAAYAILRTVSIDISPSRHANDAMHRDLVLITLAVCAVFLVVLASQTSRERGFFAPSTRDTYLSYKIHDVVMKILRA